jgi:glycogen operon protein
VEGETDDPSILSMRQRLMRTFLATLAFSQGVPMLAHGDELGRTQKGNNNAYAQDNDLTWVNWDLTPAQQELVAFTRRLLAIRQAHPVLRRRHFFRGTAVKGSKHKDLTWLRPDGAELTEEDWGDTEARALGMLIDGAATDEVDERGHAVIGDSLLLILNADEDAIRFSLPQLEDEKIWVMMVDTASDAPPRIEGGEVEVQAHALVLLRHGRDRRLAAVPELHREPLTPVEQHTP